MACLLRNNVVFLVQGYEPLIEGWSKEVRLLLEETRGSVLIDFRATRNALTRRIIRIKNGPLSFLPALPVARIVGNKYHCFSFMGDRITPHILGKGRAIATIVGPGSVEKPVREHERFHTICVECARDHRIYRESGFDESRLKVVYPCVTDGSVDVGLKEPKDRASNRVLVGSIPFSMQQFQDRGMSFALQTAAFAEDLLFVFPCRTQVVAEGLRRDAKRRGVKNLLVHKWIPASSEKLYEKIGCTAFFFTSIKNNKSCPNMAVESVQHGTPVVMTSYVGISQELKQQDVARVISLSPQEAAEAAIWTVDNANRLRERCRMVAQHMFDKRRFLNQYAGLYSDIR